MTLLRSGIIVAFFTLISRFFGLIRELFIASLFGAGNTADSVNVAFKLPNLFRKIFGEGALSTVFIPIFNDKMLESKDTARRFTGEIFTFLLITLIVTVALMQIFMPYLMFIIAPGFHEDREKFDLTVFLCRITMPYLIFISVTALFGGILNSVKKFAAFAFSPVILSIGVVGGTILLKTRFISPVSISCSLILAGILQVLFMFYFLTKAKLTFPLRIRLGDRDVKKFLIQMGPAAMSSGVQQLNLFISQSIASFVPGAISILSYADRIYQFPLSIIGVSFSTILLPELSKLYKTVDLKLATKIQDKAIKTGLLLSIPASFGIIILSKPIIHIIYERGAFLAADTIKTAQVISVFSLGLPAFVLGKILIPIFYANHDTKTPLKITTYSLLANTILNLILMLPFEQIGIALGSTIAAWYNVWLLYKYAKGFGTVSISRDIKYFCCKILTSCFFMVVTLLLIDYYYGSYFYSTSIAIKAGALVFTIAIGIFIFLLISIYLGLHKILAKE